MTDLSIIIITWNSENEILPCVESIKENLSTAKNINAELIIIDNNSSDNSFYTLKKINYQNIRVYQNESNIGYTKAVNQALRYAKGNAIFLLNPDTALLKNSISGLFNFITEHNDYGACAPRLLNENGSTQASIRNFPGYLSMLFEFTLLSFIFPGSKLFGNWKMKYFNYDRDSDVPQPMAAALMVRRDVLEKVNLMDERYIMFFNDVDLCKKIIDSGYKIRYIKDAKIIHKKGASIKKNRIRMIKTWNHDCLQYFNKHKNNYIQLLWLKINLKVTGIIRILYYRLVNG